MKEFWEIVYPKTLFKEGYHMRLRNIPGADDVVRAHPIAVQNEKDCKGKWNELFGNERPIHIEI